MNNNFSKLIPSSLSDSALHVWQVPVGSTTLPALIESLSSDERQRMSRLRQEADQHRFGITRSALRFILAAYLNDQPNAIAFSYSASGKPSLANKRLQFSVSHSHELALIALTQSEPVGVDIECVRENLEIDDLARRFFSGPEIQALEQNLFPSERRAAFFQMWTAKEAFVKATGHGLSRPLDSFDVLLNSAGDAYLAEVRPDRAEKRLWTMHTLRVAPEYAAAAVTLGRTDPATLVEVQKSMLFAE